MHSNRAPSPTPSVQPTLRKSGATLGYMIQSFQDWVAPHIPLRIEQTATRKVKVLCIWLQAQCTIWMGPRCGQTIESEGFQKFRRNFVMQPRVPRSFLSPCETIDRSPIKPTPANKCTKPWKERGTLGQRHHRTRKTLKGFRPLVIGAARIRPMAATMRWTIPPPETQLLQS